MSSIMRVIDLGRQGYGAVLELQRRLCRERIDRTEPDDVLLLVEHDPVVTLGRGTRSTSLPLEPDLLRARSAIRRTSPRSQAGSPSSSGAPSMRSHAT